MNIRFLIKLNSAASSYKVKYIFFELVSLIRMSTLVSLHYESMLLTQVLLVRVSGISQCQLYQLELAVLVRVSCISQSQRYQLELAVLVRVTGISQSQLYQLVSLHIYYVYMYVVSITYQVELAVLVSIRWSSLYQLRVGCISQSQHYVLGGLSSISQYQVEFAVLVKSWLYQLELALRIRWSQLYQLVLGGVRCIS